MFYFPSVRLLLRNLRINGVNQISYLNQLESRDFISNMKKIDYKKIVNYSQTKEFKEYKPNLKSTYKQ